MKGPKGKDYEIPVPVGISVTDENGKVIGEWAAASKLRRNELIFQNEVRK